MPEFVASDLPKFKGELSAGLDASSVFGEEGRKARNSRGRGSERGAAGKFVVSPSRDETTLAGKEKLQHKQRERGKENVHREMRRRKRGRTQ